MSDSAAPAGLPDRPVDPDWLALREPADTAARDATVDTLLPPLLRHLRDHLPARLDDDVAQASAAGGGIGVVDLGAGTGANLRWLAPRLTALGPWGALAAQRWTLVDHDPRLRSWGPASSTTVCADVADLPRLLTELGGVDLVTGAALLDLLDGPAVAAVVEAVIACAVPALLSLSVTGAVALDPTEPLDDAIRAAFDAHQHRDGRLGPNAAAEAARLFQERGWRIVMAAAPWRLGPAETDLVWAWLQGRAEAAVEWRPQLASRAEAWLDRRRAQALAGALSAVVDHVDILALPGSCTRPPATGPST